MRQSDDFFDFELENQTTVSAEDAEAEAILLLLSSPLVWRKQEHFNRHARFYGRYTFLQAPYNGGEYRIHMSKFSSAPAMYGWQRATTTWWGKRSWRDIRLWKYESDTLALVKKACEWHLHTGQWPTEDDDGWELLKE